MITLMTHTHIDGIGRAHHLFHEFTTGQLSKWDFYGAIFDEMNRRQIRLQDICDMAPHYNIPAGVIRMRRQQMINMQKGR
jgi:hypothetical protein